MKTIAVVHKNACNFENLSEYVTPLLYKAYDAQSHGHIKKNISDYIWQQINPYIQFIDVNENEFIDSISENIGADFPEKKPDQFFYHTESSYSFPKKYIEIIYAQPLWNGYKESLPENMNHIACLASLKHTVIENTCVIFANDYDMNAPHLLRLGSITRDDIIRIICRRYFFSATLITENSLVKYYYQNPQYLASVVFGLNEHNTLQHLSFAHLKYNLLYYFIQNTDKYVNQIATRINGKFSIHGDVLVLHELEENIFANISLHEIKRLNVLSYGTSADRELKSYETHTITNVDVDANGKETTKNIIPYWSRYIVIDNRMREWQQHKGKCINCNNEIIMPVYCIKCYRIKCCSNECIAQYRTTHKHDGDCAS